ncbi:M24 family metallopeptidase [Anaerotruncus rubiinfantis]|uniref:M24 family metallopeptidase n=1 Tax=Anaerotruncus rubiinfantis TaxID=1720200 RepID=UPI00189AD77D|nr:aminopeptidase P family protein [Anaerotruncus rubiinfantis]
MTIMEEIQIKLDRIRKALERLSLDAVYLKRQDNFAWMTGGGINYVGLGEMGNCSLLITRDSQYAITTNIEAARMRDEEKLEDLGYPIHCQTWYENAFEGETIRRLVPSGKVGFDHGNPAGPNISNEIRLLRFSLTESEVERYLVGGYLTARAIEETIAQARPGDSELSIIGKLAHRIRETGLDVVSAMCAADDRISNYRHPVPTDRIVRERVQLGGNMRYRGLIICCTRLMNFVPVSSQLASQYRANVEIDCTLMANSIPGQSFVSALEAGQKAYEAHGYGEEFKLHHQGGPIGYAGRDYRVDFSTPGLIQENQAFCWNPSITGTKSEDTVIATSHGIIPVSRPVICPVMTVTVEDQTFTRPAIWEG